MEVYSKNLIKLRFTFVSSVLINHFQFQSLRFLNFFISSFKLHFPFLQFHTAEHYKLVFKFNLWNYCVSFYSFGRKRACAATRFQLGLIFEITGSRSSMTYIHGFLICTAQARQPSVSCAYALYAYVIQMVSLDMKRMFFNVNLCYYLKELIKRLQKPYKVQAT